MRSKAIIPVLALSAVLASMAATPAKKSKPVGASKTATRASAPKASKAKGSTAADATNGKKAAARKNSTGKRSASKSSSARSAPKQSATRFRRSSQREPAPERYQEIQQSLADRGYFAGPVNGAWGSDSVAALKRFQRDQNIGDDGKLGALSLMALGLGPKRESSNVDGKSDAAPAGPGPP